MDCIDDWIFDLSQQEYVHQQSCCYHVPVSGSLSNFELPHFQENIFTRLDCKNKGELTMEELMNGAATDPEFQSRLRVMDIDQADLEQLFNMMLGTNAEKTWNFCGDSLEKVIPSHQDATHDFSWVESARCRLPFRHGSCTTK